MWSAVLTSVWQRLCCVVEKDLMKSVWVFFQRETETCLYCSVADTLTNLTFISGVWHWPNPKVRTHRLTDFSARSREIRKGLGLSQCGISKGVRVWVHTYRALSVSLHRCRLHQRELPTVQSVVTFTAETIGKSGNYEGKQQHDTRPRNGPTCCPACKTRVWNQVAVSWASAVWKATNLKWKFPNRQVSATSLLLNVAKVTCDLVKCCPDPISTYLSPCGLTHSLT